MTDVKALPRLDYASELEAALKRAKDDSVVALDLATTVLDYVMCAQEIARYQLYGRDPSVEKKNEADQLFNKMISLARSIQYPASA